MVAITATRAPIRGALRSNVVRRVTPWIVKSPVTGNVSTTPGAGIVASGTGFVSTNIDVGYLLVSRRLLYFASWMHWQVTVRMLTMTRAAVTVYPAIVRPPDTSCVRPTTWEVSPI